MPPKTFAKPREWLRRLDRLAADLNVLLLLFAAGLAALDLSVLVTQKLVDRVSATTETVISMAAPVISANPFQ